MSDMRMFANRLHNALWTGGALLGMILLTGAVGYTLAGPLGFVMAAGSVVMLTILAFRSSSARRLRVAGGRDLNYYDAPGLYETVAELCRRAGLEHIPRLVYLPAAAPVAFSAGTGPESMIAVSDLLLRNLNRDEIEGVLAHEISHLANDDIPILILSDVIVQITSSYSRLGVFMLILSFPITLFSGHAIPLSTCLLLMSAPVLSVLLKLFLSRTREFQADLSAAALVGTPLGLMSALQKIETVSLPFWARFFRLPSPDTMIPEWLRTHPDTEERIRRLSELSSDGGAHLPHYRVTGY